LLTGRVGARLLAVTSPDELAAAFRARGLKLTPQRNAVFRALDGNVSHPTAESVHAAVVAELPNVSLRTVYSVLAELADIGAVNQLELGTGAYRFDPNVDAHHHLVCDRCGQVRDVHVDHPEVRPDATDGDGFQITGTEIVFRGVCGTCARQDGTEPAAPAINRIPINN
jgi:Fe2+ or Zn2+ uptake regulation protein